VEHVKNVRGWGRETHTGLQWGGVKAREQFENLGACGKIMLSWGSHKHAGTA
jgi:hypothetical protein